MIAKTIVIAIIFNIVISANLMAAAFGQYKLQEYDSPKKIEDIELYNELGEKHLIEQYQDKVILLHIWATWDMFTANKLYDLSVLQKKYKKQNLKIITVSADYKKPEFIKDFYESKKITNLEIFVDPKKIIMQSLDTKFIPVTVIIDSEGFEVARFSGNINWLNDKKLKDILEKYLSSKL